MRHTALYGSYNNGCRIMENGAGDGSQQRLRKIKITTKLAHNCNYDNRGGGYVIEIGGGNDTRWQ